VRRDPYPGARLDVLSPPPQSQANSTAALRFDVKLVSLLLAAKRIMFLSGKVRGTHSIGPIGDLFCLSVIKRLQIDFLALAGYQLL
jgi:hypothetical protein